MSKTFESACPARVRGRALIAAAAMILMTAACSNPVTPDTNAPAIAPSAANTSRVSGTADENCTYSISTASERFDRAGGEGSVAVQTASGCHWTVAADAPWVTITGGTNMAGNGPGTITYRVSAAAEDRRATLTAAGQTVAIVQGSVEPPTPTTVPCAISAAARPAAFPATSGSGTLDVTSACPWVATAPSWITGVTRGNGTVSVPFGVSATTVARDGTIVISPAAGFSGSPASVRITQVGPIAPRLTTTFNPNPVAPIANGCPNSAPTWRYTITLRETNGGTFNVTSWSQTITPTGAPTSSTTNYPGSDFVAQFGTATVRPNNSVTSQQIGVCLGGPIGGSTYYTLTGVDSTGNRVTYTTPTLVLENVVVLQGGHQP